LMGGVQAFGFIGLFVGPAVLALGQSLLSLVREETHTQSDKPAPIVSEEPVCEG
jgi:predicted PurR-regulated permease PerM